MKNTLKKIICIITAVIISVVSLVVSASAEIIVDKNIYVGKTKFGNIQEAISNTFYLKNDSANAIPIIIIYYKDGIPKYITNKQLISYYPFSSGCGGVIANIANGITTTAYSNEIQEINVNVTKVTATYGEIQEYSYIPVTVKYENTVANITKTETIRAYSNIQVMNITTKRYITEPIQDTGLTYKIFTAKYTSDTPSEEEKTTVSNSMNEFQSEILNGGNISEEYQVTRDSTTGKIMTAGQPTNSENGTLMVSKGWYEDTATIGNMMFLINDHDQKHNYTIKVSENKIIHSIIETQISNYDWYDNTENNWLANILGNAVSVNWNEKLYTVFENLMTSVEFYKLKPYLTDMNEVAFDLKGYIKNDIMDFSKDDPLKRTKIIGVNLSDYINMVRYAVYKVELIDINENRVLDTTYIMANDTRSINSTKLGTVAWQYESNDNALNDLTTNNTPTSYISKINNGVGTYSSNYTTSDPGGYNNENVANIQDVITDINAYVEQVNGFFKAVYGLFPPEIWNIIYVGFGCVIASAIIKILI